MKEAVEIRKEAHMAMCQSNTEKNKKRHKSMKNEANKAISKAMREKAEEALTGLQNGHNWMFRQVRGIKTDTKKLKVEGVCDGKLCFTEKERGNVRKDYMERIVNEEYDCNHNVEGDAVESPAVCVS